VLRCPAAATEQIARARPLRSIPQAIPVVVVLIGRPIEAGGGTEPEHG
jgi:hypothetical protein